MPRSLRALSSFFAPDFQLRAELPQRLFDFRDGQIDHAAVMSKRASGLSTPMTGLAIQREMNRTFAFGKQMPTRWGRPENHHHRNPQRASAVNQSGIATDNNVTTGKHCDRFRDRVAREVPPRRQLSFHPYVFRQVSFRGSTEQHDAGSAFRQTHGELAEPRRTPSLRRLLRTRYHPDDRGRRTGQRRFQILFVFGSIQSQCRGLEIRAHLSSAVEQAVGKRPIRRKRQSFGA